MPMQCLTFKVHRRVLRMDRELYKLTFKIFEIVTNSMYVIIVIILIWGAPFDGKYNKQEFDKNNIVFTER